MGRDILELMYNLEDRHWWYAGLRDIVLPAIERSRDGNSDLRVLDAGCGTGGLLERLEGEEPFGLDIVPEALSFCRKRGCKRLLLASISDIPFADSSFDAIVSLDVMCCLEPAENGGALAEMHRVLKRGGTLILNLPAYQWLHSRHDRAVGTVQRFSARGFGRQLGRAGFVVSKMTYRNTLLFPAAALKRLIDKGRAFDSEAEGSDIKAIPVPLNSFLTGMLMLENRFLSRFKLPFGLSLFCIARKA